MGKYASSVSPGESAQLMPDPPQHDKVEKPGSATQGMRTSGTRDPQAADPKKGPAPVTPPASPKK